jgi:hypothetical protein
MSLEGRWVVSWTTQMGVTEEVWDVATVDGVLRARITAPDVESMDEPVVLDGDGFSLQLPLPGLPMKANVTGRLEGDAVTGEGKIAVMKFGTFEGTRS